MSWALIVFTASMSALRGVYLTDEEGNPWFVAREICDVLGYAHVGHAVTKHCKYAKLLKGNESVLLGFGPRGVYLLKESDLYRLVMRSKVPHAEAFQDWVTDEVLPAIRKTECCLVRIFDPEKLSFWPT